jgi:hypothetical protein
MLNLSSPLPGRAAVNLIILKYGILIGALLTTTVFVSGTFNNSSALQGDQNSSEINAQSVFAFGSQVFYKDVSQPGNEYMQGSVQGYSQNLVPNDTENQAYASSWQTGVAEFESGYNKCSAALFDLASVPSMQTNQQKMAVCQEFLDGENEMTLARSDFLSAKGSTSPAVDSGFTIAMVLERVDEIIQSSDDADQACMKAVLADHDHDPTGFSENLKVTQSAVQEMERVYPELKVLSSDFT